MQIKIIRRTEEPSLNFALGQFSPKVLDAIELYYAPNHALRVTRQELTELLVALQADLECREGIIGLVQPTNTGAKQSAQSQERAWVGMTAVRNCP
jgi:hypothetical protein